MATLKKEVISWSQSHDTVHTSGPVNTNPVKATREKLLSHRTYKSASCYSLCCVASSGLLCHIYNGAQVAVLLR